MTVLDLFCGLGGFSAAFRARGHRVVGVDLVPPADVIGDVRRLPVDWKPDVVLASPPCTQFSRKAMKCFTGWNGVPSMELMNSALTVIEDLKPEWWIIENVGGARPFMPVSSQRIGSRWFWGEFPLVLHEGHGIGHGKWHLSSTASRERSRIPYRISELICEAMEAAS